MREKSTGMSKQSTSRLSFQVGLTLLLVAASLAFAAPPPNIRLPGLDGGALTSADLGSGNVVVIVWASWSPRCRDIVERANAIQQKWHGQARVVTVDFQEDGARVREFLSGKQLQAPVYLDSDGAFSKSMAVTSLPGLVIFHGGSATYQGKLPADVDSTIERSLK